MCRNQEEGLQKMQEMILSEIEGASLIVQTMKERGGRTTQKKREKENREKTKSINNDNNNNKHQEQWQQQEAK